MRLSTTICFPALCALMLFAACNDDSTTNPPTTTTQKIEVLSGQTPDNGMLKISRVIASQDGWVVIHRDNGGNAPAVPAIIGKAQVSKGTTTDLSISLDSGVSNGEKLWAMLHVDDGVVGQYEFNGAGTPDQPVTEDGQIVMTQFTIQQTNPMVAVSDQMPNDGEVVIEQVKASENGWLVVHASQNGAPGTVLGQAPVQVGENLNVVVMLDTMASNAVSSGDTLWAMLHVDRGTEGTYEFPGADVPVKFDGSVVMMPFVVSGSDIAAVAVSNQTVTNNEVTITLVDARQVGWIVIHEDDNGSPKVPATIGRSRVMIGANNNVKVKLEKNVSKGDRLWAMLHIDNGTIGQYEFNGETGTFDPPAMQGGEIVMRSFVVQ